MSKRVRFGSFELDLRSGELRGNDGAVVLPEQQFQVLRMLVDCAGAIVTREEIKKKLWPNDTVVEFDHCINTAIRNLRRALSDSADVPQYIETVARRGYRLVMSVEWVEAAADPSQQSQSLEPPPEAPEFKVGNLTGKIVTHYRVLEIIGGGGMGMVYRAEDLKLGRAVALKFLPEELSNDAQALARFEREARAVSALSHPNICPIYEFDEYADQPFIVMELLHGKTLRDHLADGAFRLNDPAALDIAIQAASGLEGAHEQGVTHRDIKPANIFITEKNVAKILDFGVAKVLEHSEPLVVTAALNPADVPSTHLPTNLTRTGLKLGTPGYMSPEQIRGEAVDSRTDIFSFGLVLYEMATGERAFSGETETIQHEAILTHDPRPVRELASEISPPLEAIISKCLEKDRANRYQTATELALDLRGLSAPSITQEARYPTVEITQARSKRRLWAAAALAVLAAAIGVTYWLFRPRTPVVTAIHQLTHTGLLKSNFGTGYLPVTDGTRVFFNEFKDGKWHIAQISTKGGEVSYLDLPVIENPIISDMRPDGSELLINNRHPTTAGTAFWLFPLPDGPARRIPGTFAGMMLQPGNQIIYRDPSDALHLFVSDLDGGNSRSLVTLPRDVSSNFGVSPDLAFSPGETRMRYGTNDGRIWESHLDGTGKHTILPGFHQPFCCLNWSSDGKLFLLASPVERVYNLWAVNESGWSRIFPPSRPTQLTFGPISFQFATASTDGKHIFASGQTLRGELSIYDAQSGLLRKYLGGISAGFTDFSRDGKWIAYVTHPQGVLWRSRIDGSERLQLTFPPMGPVLNPKWSPDGRFIVFTLWGEADGSNIYLVSADGGGLMLLLSGDFNPNCPSWSPDGKSLAYGGLPSFGGAGVRTEIRIFKLETKESRTVPRSHAMFSPTWSPDGRHLSAISNDMKQLWVFSFDTEHWLQLPLPKLPKSAGVGWNWWSHDGRYLYYMSGSTVYRTSILRGQPEVVADVTGIDIECPLFPWGNWFGLTPDDRVLMLLDRSVDEVYALDLEYR